VDRGEVLQRRAEFDQGHTQTNAELRST
jgi:hypothetical protein